MSASEGLALILALALFAFEPLIDFVTARAPLPPARAGRPTPSRYCVSFALRVLRVTGGGGVGSTLARGTDWTVAAVFLVFLLVPASTSLSWIMTEPPERSLGREPAEDLLMILRDDDRFGIDVGGRRRGLDVSIRRSISASDLRFAFNP